MTEEDDLKEERLILVYGFRVVNSWSLGSADSRPVVRLRGGDGVAEQHCSPSWKPGRSGDGPGARYTP